MAGIDRRRYEQEKRVLKRKMAAAKYAEKVGSQHTATTGADTSQHESDKSSSATDSSTDSCEMPDLELKSPTCSKRVRGKVDLVTPELAAAFDRTNTSDRNAAHILNAARITVLENL